MNIVYKIRNNVILPFYRVIDLIKMLIMKNERMICTGMKLTDSSIKTACYRGNRLKSPSR